MTCPKCGADLPEKASKCPSCLEPVDGKPNGADEQPLRRAAPRVVYASLWRRAVAYVLDTFLLSVVAGLLIPRPLLERAGIAPGDTWALMTGDSRQILAIKLLLTMASWLYWSVMESSPWRATVGKRILGIEVTDLQGRRISLARATGRYFGKIILVGFLLIPFTEKRQAFHDLISGCLVVRRIPPRGVV